MSKLGKRLYLEVHGAPRMNGEWEIVALDTDDFNLPYLAELKNVGLQLWMTPRFLIGIYRENDHKITELN